MQKNNCKHLSLTIRRQHSFRRHIKRQPRAECIEDRANAHRAGNSPSVPTIASHKLTGESNRVWGEAFSLVRSFYVCTCIVKHVPLSWYETGQGGPACIVVQLAGPNRLFAQQRVPLRYQVHEGEGWYAVVRVDGQICI